MTENAKPLSRREREALADIDGWLCGYRFRQSSMRKLAAHGFVKKRNPMENSRAPEWRITPEGRSKLAELKP